MAEHSESRRRFLKVLGTGAAAVGSVAIGLNALQKGDPKSEVQIRRTLPTVTPQRFEIPKPSEKLKTPEQLLLARLQEIANADIFSHERIALEKAFVNEAQTAEEFDKGFWVIQNQKSREQLRDKKWHLRQNGNSEKTGLQKLPDRLKKFAEGKAIHPETLAWCWEANDEINETLEALGIGGGSDLSHRLNSGGLATLLTHETKGFTQVGNARATEQMPEYERWTLFDLCEELKPIMGITLSAPNIAGSEETFPGAQNGGAVGGQFRAVMALHLNDIYRPFQKKFNPFDIRSSVVGGSILIGSSKDMAYPGFVRGNESREIGGLTNWFGYHPEAIKSVLNVDRDYQREIVNAQISSF